MSKARRYGSDPWRKVYLGDGLYADYDGSSLWLTAEDGINVTNVVCLEPDVYVALWRYVQSLTCKHSECVAGRAALAGRGDDGDHPRDR